MIFLCLSLVLNIALGYAIYRAERISHVFGLALERRNIITIEDKARPDYWAVAGWTNTVAKLHTDFDAVFFGNSITRGSDFQQCFPDKKIINLGYPGDNMVGMLMRVRMIQAANPKKVFVMAGTNDIFHVSVEEYAERYNTLLDAITDSLPDAKIYLMSILPMNKELNSSAPKDEKIQAANNAVSKIAEERNMTFIDIYSLYAEDGQLPQSVTKDGVHIFKEQYARWAEAIEPFIME